MSRKLRVLLLVEQCDPRGYSVPLVGYRLFNSIRPHVDATLVTRDKYRENLIPVMESSQRVDFLKPGFFAREWGKLIPHDTLNKPFNWQLWHALKFPLYAEFNRQVYRRYKQEISAQHFDIVHAITPMVPRYPFKIVKACRSTPFVLGPVNGGLPFPKGFEDIAQEEFSKFNFLRRASYLLPNYRKSYQRATRVLAGSSYTLEMLQRMFQIKEHRLQLYFENGISESFFHPKSEEERSKKKIKLLFVGRLVPYKGPKFLLNALSRLSPACLAKVHLTLVGEGPERPELEKQIRNLGLKSNVELTGFISQESTSQYYQEADIFCFPSIREFGGAVVLEAMASGLPCIVTTQGGIAEYTGPDCSIQLPLDNEDLLTRKLAESIQELVDNPSKRKAMGEAAYRRALDFEWSRKGEQMVEIYENCLRNP